MTRAADMTTNILQYSRHAYVMRRHIPVYVHEAVRARLVRVALHVRIGRLRLVGSLKLYVSSAKGSFKKDYVLPKRPIILMNLLIVASP